MLKSLLLLSHVNGITGKICGIDKNLLVEHKIFSFIGEDVKYYHTMLADMRTCGVLISLIFNILWTNELTDEKINYWGIFVQNQSVLPSLILLSENLLLQS